MICQHIVDSFSNFCPECGVAKDHFRESLMYKTFWNFYRSEVEFQNLLKDKYIPKLVNPLLSKLYDSARVTNSKFESKSSDSESLSEQRVMRNRQGSLKLSVTLKKKPYINPSAQYTYPQGYGRISNFSLSYRCKS